MDFNYRNRKKVALFFPLNTVITVFIWHFLFVNISQHYNMITAFLVIFVNIMWIFLLLAFTNDHHPHLPGKMHVFLSYI